MKTDTPQPIRLADYRPPAVLVDSIELTFDLDPDATWVRAENQVQTFSSCYGIGSTLRSVVATALAHHTPSVAGQLNNSDGYQMTPIMRSNMR